MSTKLYENKIRKTDSLYKIKIMKKNNVVGTWNLISAYIDNHGNRLDILGSHPMEPVPLSICDLP